MTPRNLYLHETVDIVGQGQYDYMEHVAKEPTNVMPGMLTVRPGSAIDYLAAVVEEQVPLWREYGHEPTGIYEVLGNQHEVVVVWATSIAAQTGLRASRDAAYGLSDEADADERLVAWERESVGFVTGGDTHLMTPLPGTVYGPDDWEAATLDDWLKPPDAYVERGKGC